MNIQEVDLHIVLELLRFLHTEGKTVTSELETKLADYLYDSLIVREMADEIILFTAFILSTFDNSNSKFEDSRAIKVENLKIMEINMSFDPKSSQYSSFIKEKFLLF